MKLIELAKWDGKWHDSYTRIMPKDRIETVPAEYVGKHAKVVMSFALKSDGAYDETTRAGGTPFLAGATVGNWTQTNKTADKVPSWTALGVESNQKPYGFNKVRDTSTFMTTAGWAFKQSLQPSINNTAWLRSESVVLADTVGASYFYDVGDNGPNEVRLYIEVGE